ncbi:MAG: helix-turn-helix domain-containing protein [Leptospirillia bacterium]
MSEPVQSESVATILLRSREAKGLTVDDVDSVTHISPGWVSVMERGDWNQYPSMVYARGHVKVYAEFLGLDVPSMLVQFQKDWAKTASPEPVEPNGKSTSIRPITQSGGDARLYWVVAGIVAVLILGGLAVKHEKHKPDHRVPAASVPPPTSIRPSPAVAISGTQSGSTSAPSLPPASTPSATAGREVPLPPSTSPPNMTRSSALSLAPQGQPSTSNRLTLRMVGLKSVWVIVSVDDGTVRHFRLNPGDERTLVGKNFMTFSTQAGDGLVLFLNGKRLGLAGPTSAPVLHRRINRQTLHHLKVVVSTHSSGTPSASKSLPHKPLIPTEPSVSKAEKSVKTIPLVPSSSNGGPTGSSVPNPSLTPSGGSN